MSIPSQSGKSGRRLPTMPRHALAWTIAEYMRGFRRRRRNEIDWNNYTAYEVRIIGALSTLWVVVSNFLVHPIVGVADERPEFRAAPREVAALIEAPVRALVDDANVRLEERVRDGLLVRYPYFDIAGHHIWGATAMILGELRETLK